MSEQRMPREMPLRAWLSLCLAFCPGTLISHCPVHSLNGGTQRPHLQPLVCICTCYRYPNLSLSRDVICPSAHIAPEPDGKSHDKCSWDQVFRLDRGFLRSQQGQDPEEGDESLLSRPLTLSLLPSESHSYTFPWDSPSVLEPQRCLHVPSPNSSSSKSPRDKPRR